MAARTTRRPLRGATAQKRPAGARCRRWRRRTKRRRDARDGRVVDAGIRPLRRHRGISAGGGTTRRQFTFAAIFSVVALRARSPRWRCWPSAGRSRRGRTARRRRARAASSRT